MYVNALLDFIIVFLNLEETILPYLSISQIVEKASLYTSERSEHKFSVSNLGNISVLLLTRYTVVERFLA